MRRGDVERLFAIFVETSNCLKIIDRVINVLSEAWLTAFVATYSELVGLFFVVKIKANLTLLISLHLHTLLRPLFSLV